ncbi:MAG TPA: hypothetical protein DDW84_08760 [Phycisphaerales bacterium]|nr:MAG: hypothetical protein A2Y13_09545 [Planctomycetes bacterium GWC2_45_44]HBG78909.1 hypothetical protein [Phycisphaerales bacterium]HBR18855.1 hypothetical protein [Phycisphaerales bacterium]
MKKLLCLCGLLAVLLILPVSAIQATSVTVATFADPSGNAGDPLLTVNWTDSTINGGWADIKSGLLLQIPIAGVSFADAWFEMDEITITNTMVFGGSKFGETGEGQVRFYAAGSTTNPLLRIDFQKGMVGRQFVSAEDEDGLFYANNVTITGSAIPFTLSYEQFSFSFANVTNLPNADGFTGTASFTSSAVPEPATVALLCIGALGLLRRKK